MLARGAARPSCGLPASVVSRLLRAAILAALAPSALAQTYCCPGFGGAGCATTLQIASLNSNPSGAPLAGSVTYAGGGNLTDCFGSASSSASPDLYFAIYVPAGSNLLRLDTCHAETTFDTGMTVLVGLAGDSSGRSITTAVAPAPPPPPWLLEYNDDGFGPCADIVSPLVDRNRYSKIELSGLPEGWLYVVVDGWSSNFGGLGLKWPF